MFLATTDISLSAGKQLVWLCIKIRNGFRVGRILKTTTNTYIVSSSIFTPPYIMLCARTGGLSVKDVQLSPHFTIKRRLILHYFTQLTTHSESVKFCTNYPSSF